MPVAAHWAFYAVLVGCSFFIGCAHHRASHDSQNGFRSNPGGTDSVFVPESRYEPSTPNAPTPYELPPGSAYGGSGSR